MADNATTSTVSLSTSAPGTVSEGEASTRARTVAGVHACALLVLTLSNGQTNTILAGQTTGSVDYTVRGDDAYAQGTSALPAVTIRSEERRGGEEGGCRGAV